MQSSSVRIGWILMVITGIYLSVIGLILVFTAETTFVPYFESFTAKSWSYLLTDYPRAGELFLMTERLLGAITVASALLVIFVSWKSYSKAEKWS